MKGKNMKDDDKARTTTATMSVDQLRQIGRLMRKVDATNIEAQNMVKQAIDQYNKYPSKKISIVPVGEFDSPITIEFSVNGEFSDDLDVCCDIVCGKDDSLISIGVDQMYTLHKILGYILGLK